MYDISTGKKLDLRGLLSKTTNVEIDLKVALGAMRLPCRIIAIKLSEEACQKRLRHLLEKRRKDKRIKENINDVFNQWSIFVTNLPASVNPEKIILLYRLRWQIELLFKAMKTFLKLRSIPEVSKPRAQIAIYISLIAIVLLSLVIITITTEEISLYKASKIFVNHIRDFIDRLNKKETCAITWFAGILKQFALKESRNMRPSTRKSLDSRPPLP